MTPERPLQGPEGDTLSDLSFVQKGSSKVPGKGPAFRATPSSGTDLL
jgi:hypothetical protein